MKEIKANILEGPTLKVLNFMTRSIICAGLLTSFCNKKKLTLFFVGIVFHSISHTKIVPSINCYKFYRQPCIAVPKYLMIHKALVSKLTKNAKIVSPKTTLLENQVGLLKTSNKLKLLSFKTVQNQVYT